MTGTMTKLLILKRYFSTCQGWMMFKSDLCRRMAENNFKPFPHFATDALHAGQDPDQWNSKAVVPPISLATTFKQEEPGKHSVR